MSEAKTLNGIVLMVGDGHNIITVNDLTENADLPKVLQGARILLDEWRKDGEEDSEVVTDSPKPLSPAGEELEVSPH